MDQLIITPAGLLEILSSIEELKDVEVSVVESGSAGLDVTVGTNTYHIQVAADNTVGAPADVINEVEAINDEAYSELESSGDVELSDRVESGILKELAKTLLVGGLVRLTKRLVAGGN